MTRFPRSVPNRKKQVPPPPMTNGQPMSKAQKILGSTPLSIDCPRGWDDAASSIISDSRSDTPASVPESVLFSHEDDHRVFIVKPDDRWGEESDILPDSLRLDAAHLGSSTEDGGTDTPFNLRKSFSSSTIRSWYDKSKLPLSISQQTSSSAIAKGLPHRKYNYDHDDIGDMGGNKKKPTRLNISLSAVRKGMSKSGKSHDRMSSGLAMLKSPAMFSPFSPKSTTSRSSLRPPSRGIREKLGFPADEPAPSTGSVPTSRLGSGALRELPSLYDHYEQMSMRDVMKEDSAPGLKTIDEKMLILADDLDGLYEDDVADQKLHRRENTASGTQKVVKFTKPDCSSLPKDVKTRSISRHRAKTSKASRSTDTSLDNADLLETSVLLLSSDSEDEGRPVRRQSPTTQRRHTADKRGRGALDASPTKTSPSKNRPGRSNKQAKRGSFATPSTYKSIPTSATGRMTPVSIDSLTAMPLGILSSQCSPRRHSFMSDLSTLSGMAQCRRSRYSFHESPDVNMLPGRAEFSTEMLDERRSEASANAGGPSRSPRLRQCSSTDQLTPPLSPSSVDFYIRPAASSVDDMGTHSRLMAVTHQEHMLLSALRNKQQAMRNAATSLSQEYDDKKDKSGTGRANEAHLEIGSDSSSENTDSSVESRFSKELLFRDSQTTINRSTIDFGFPAPPSFNSGSSEKSVTISERRKSSSALRLKTSSVIPLSPGPPPMLSLPPLPRYRGSQICDSSPETVSAPAQQDVPLYHDDVDPSPDMADIRDWESATSPVVGVMTPDSLIGASWQKGDDCQSAAKRNSRMSVRNSSTCHESTDTCRPSMDEIAAAEDACSQEVPRPDSPVSPEMVPGLLTKRAMLSSKLARLSAVGPGQLSHDGEPGWWGDED